MYIYIYIYVCMYVYVYIYVYIYSVPEFSFLFADFGSDKQIIVLGDEQMKTDRPMCVLFPCSFPSRPKETHFTVYSFFGAVLYYVFFGAVFSVPMFDLYRVFIFPIRMECPALCSGSSLVVLYYYHCIYIYICIYVRMYVCMYVCVYIYIYMYVCMCVYIYIYKYTNKHI